MPTSSVPTSIVWNWKPNFVVEYSKINTIQLFKKTDNETEFEWEISNIYFTDQYIDFSQEENRNKFVDQLGYPRDLKKAIDSGEIPEPLIYLPFDDPNNLWKNLGTGWDFTVNWTVTQGADVNPN